MRLVNMTALRSTVLFALGLAIGFGTGLVAAAADDAAPMPANIVVAKNGHFEMPYFVWDQESCKVKERPKIEILTPSTHGALDAVPYIFEQKDAMKNCFGRNMAAVKLVYSPVKDFTGEDHFVARFGAYFTDHSDHMGWSAFDVHVTVK